MLLNRAKILAGIYMFANTDTIHNKSTSITLCPKNEFLPHKSIHEDHSMAASTERYPRGLDGSRLSLLPLLPSFLFKDGLISSLHKH